MISASGRFVIASNGEIYNHLEIRGGVERSGFNHWQGHSDTETLLAGFDVLGIEETLRQAVGMFALAVWDRQKRTLSLARDRMGEKPLYYGYAGEAFVFGSELKALLQAPRFAPRIDRGSLSAQLRYNYVPARVHIYQDLAQLPPATLLEVSAYEVLHRAWPATRAYWSAKESAEAGVADPLNFSSDDEAADGLESVLRQSVAAQMVADVPVGAFLSGGIDRSLVVSLMQTQTSRPVKTFTIGFNESGYDEAVFAKQVARHLGTEHTELYVCPQEALNVIPKLPEIYCEPFSDSTQIPNYLISQLARRHVTVSLSGDGGDELFGGYDRYLLAVRLWNKLERVPLALRRMTASTIQSISPVAWNMVSAPLTGLIPEKYRRSTVGDRLHKGAELLHFEIRPIPLPPPDELLAGGCGAWGG